MNVSTFLTREILSTLWFIIVTTLIIIFCVRRKKLPELPEAITLGVISGGLVSCFRLYLVFIFSPPELDKAIEQYITNNGIYTIYLGIFAVIWSSIRTITKLLKNNTYVGTLGGHYNEQIKASLLITCEKGHKYIITGEKSILDEVKDWEKIQVINVTPVISNGHKMIEITSKNQIRKLDR